MNSGSGLFLPFGIGVVNGLRTLTAPAVVAWAAHLGWINLSGSWLAFMGSVWAVGFFTLGALVEYVLDLLPSTPARTAAFPLSARILMGALTGACLGTAGGASPWLAAGIGSLGAILGTFGGYRARVGLDRALKVPDFVVGVSEDVVAIGLGVFLVSRF